MEGATVVQCRSESHLPRPLTTLTSKENLSVERKQKKRKREFPPVTLAEALHINTTESHYMVTTLRY